MGKYENCKIYRKSRRCQVIESEKIFSCEAVNLCGLNLYEKLPSILAWRGKY